MKARLIPPRGVIPVVTHRTLPAEVIARMERHKPGSSEYKLKKVGKK